MKTVVPSAFRFFSSVEDWTRFKFRIRNRGKESGLTVKKQTSMREDVAEIGKKCKQTTDESVSREHGKGKWRWESN